MAGPGDTAFCNCCISPVPRAPADVWNRPGLSQIKYRIGTFATFRETMLEAIAAEPALAALTTRNSDDYAITLFELLAAMGDVLTFYNERIANELFLRTAAERDSILRLVRMIGYELRPGLAATTLLAFGLDAGAETRIAPRLRVMSVPGQDETAQTFETVEDVAAHGDLNAVPIFAPGSPVNAFQKGQTSALLNDAAAAVAEADQVVFFAKSSVEEKIVTARDELARGTRLTFTPAVQAADWWSNIASVAKVSRRLRFFGFNAPDTYTYYDQDPSVPVQYRWKSATTATGLDGSLLAYPLDAHYDDLKPGARLLVDAGLGTSPQLITATVVATSEMHATLANLADTVTWAQVRQTIRGRPTVVGTSAGVQKILARGGAGSVLAFDPATSAWQSFGGFVAASDISAVSPSSGRIDAFARGEAGQLATTTWTAGSWSSWSSFGGVITTAPKALALASGELIVFARGLDFALWCYGVLPAPSPWASRGGGIASDPEAVSWGGSRIDLFVRGFDRGLWHMTRDAGVWSDWMPLAGKLASGPVAATTGPNRIDVVALADGGALIHRRWEGSKWTDWLDLGGQVKGSPAILATGADRIDVFVRGSDDQLWQITRTGDTWSGWVALGGSLGSAPGVALAPGVAHLVARDSDGSIIRRNWYASGWSGWAHAEIGLGAVADRRKARIYELANQDIVFRDFDYPLAFAGGRMAIRLPPGYGADNLGGFAKLAKGRRVVVEASASEHIATVTGALAVASKPGEPEDHLLVDFEPPVAKPIVDPKLRGNIVRASHGETQPDETLGNSDASRAFLKFKLARSPLTYLPSDTDIQGRAALEVRIGGVLWQPVPSLYGQSSTARVYTARRTDAGDTVVTFGGNGSGAPTPTGAMSVVARYRRGVGSAGRVRAGQLSTLLDRPVGLRDVVNPLDADGGVDPETRDDARSAAPTTVRTFGRIVSLKDFEWLATSSGLVSRAFATWVWYDLQRAVHLTIAGPAGSRLSAPSCSTVYAALTAARDPNHRLLLANLVRVPLVVRARIVPDPAYEPDAVLQSARAALLSLFAFEAVPLGAAVHASHVYAALQAGEGVRAVGLDTFNLKGFATLTAVEAAVRAVTTDSLQSHVRIFPARPTPDDPMLIDRYARAGFDGPALPPVLAAEQAFIEDPLNDVQLLVAGAL